MDELRVLLAETEPRSSDLMDRAQRTWPVRLPGTMAAFKAGGLPESKVTIIAYRTAPLDDPPRPGG